MVLVGKRKNKTFINTIINTTTYMNYYSNKKWPLHYLLHEWWGYVFNKSFLAPLYEGVLVTLNCMFNYMQKIMTNLLRVKTYDMLTPRLVFNTNDSK